jgi:hypothetical protein
VSGSRRAPGWREVIGIAAVVLAVVFGVELASLLLPPIGALFSSFPTTIVVLVAATVWIVVLAVGRRRRE